MRRRHAAKLCCREDWAGFLIFIGAGAFAGALQPSRTSSTRKFDLLLRRDGGPRPLNRTPRIPIGHPQIMRNGRSS
jgi:hypothetical protein